MAPLPFSTEAIIAGSPFFMIAAHLSFSLSLGDMALWQPAQDLSNTALPSGPPDEAPALAPPLAPVEAESRGRLPAEDVSAREPAFVDSEPCAAAASGTRLVPLEVAFDELP